MPRTDRGTRHGECRFRHRAIALDRDPRRRAHRMLRHAGRLSHRRAVAQDHPDVAIDESKRLFERSLPPGTILVSAPGQRLEMRVTPPFDFLHFHVANRLLRDEGLAADQDDFVPCELSPFRDTLAEALGRSLLEENVHRSQPEYARVVAKAIVMRAIGRQQAKAPLLGAAKMADEAAGAVYCAQRRQSDQPWRHGRDSRSKMHFAAQFRALTGFRPREYLLFKRIERAKAVMTETGMPLVEVAFAAGFNAQAHFSTVFKRFTGKTPAQSAGRSAGTQSREASAWRPGSARRAAMRSRQSPHVCKPCTFE